MFLTNQKGEKVRFGRRKKKTAYRPPNTRFENSKSALASRAAAWNPICLYVSDAWWTRNRLYAHISAAWAAGYEVLWLIIPDKTSRILLDEVIDALRDYNGYFQIAIEGSPATMDYIVSNGYAPRLLAFWDVGGDGSVGLQNAPIWYRWYGKEKPNSQCIDYNGRYYYLPLSTYNVAE